MTLWALKNTQLLYKETSLRFFAMTENTGFQVIFAANGFWSIYKY